jgi:hypothetical protein
MTRDELERLVADLRLQLLVARACLRAADGERRLVQLIQSRMH